MKPLHRLFFHAPRQVKTQNGLRLVDYVFVKGLMSASILDIFIITFVPVGLHIGIALDQPILYHTQPLFYPVRMAKANGHNLGYSNGPE
jgi:hypothetical protein